MHRIASDRIQRRRTQRLARAQAKARVMPRAADSLLDNQAFRQRAAVMRASCASGKDVVALPHQHHRLAIDLAEQRRILLKLVDVDAGFQVRSFRLFVAFRHAGSSLRLRSHRCLD
jgi:hypothetical protein